MTPQDSPGAGEGQSGKDPWLLSVDPSPSGGGKERDADRGSSSGRAPGSEQMGQAEFWPIFLFLLTANKSRIPDALKKTSREL